MPVYYPPEPWFYHPAFKRFEHRGISIVPTVYFDKKLLLRQKKVGQNVKYRWFLFIPIREVEEIFKEVVVSKEELQQAFTDIEIIIED